MRACQIFFVVLRYVFREAFYRSRWGKKRLQKRPQIQIDYKSTPQRVRLAIEELGPTFVKFGQILADRPDIVSESLRIELKRLQTKANPIDDNTAIRLIEDELGRPLMEIFSEFDMNCLASASIGQVYQAKLKDGEDVIVKIQRPRIQEKISIDLRLMRILAKKFVLYYPEMAAINIVGFVNEFAKRITNELDYKNEENNIRRFTIMFQENPLIYVPKTYPEYTTRKLLIMEKITGISPDNIFELHHQNYDTKQVAETGANALLKMIMEYGFFHADPHAGNIFIMPNNVIAFIDYGMVGVLRPREMTFLADFCLGFVRKDSRSIAKSLITLCNAKFFDEKEELEFDIDEIIKANSYRDVEEIDLADIMQQCINVIVKYRLSIPSGIFMLVKALASIQQFALALDPQISLLPIITPYARNLVMQKYHPKKIASQLYDTLASYIDLVTTFPNSINEILYKLKQGKIHHEILVQETDGLNRTLRQLTYRFASVLLIVGLFVGSSILVVFSDKHDYGRAGLIISTIIISLLLIRMMFVKRK